MACDISGGNGISSERRMMRHARNLETVNTHEGKHEVYALVLGGTIAGIRVFVEFESLIGMRLGLRQ